MTPWSALRWTAPPRPMAQGENLIKKQKARDTR
jgi:hypothetical protein